MVSRRSAARVLATHFELVAYAWFWLTAALLAALAGRPWLGAVGLLTVLPFVVAYVVVARAAARRRSP